MTDEQKKEMEIFFDGIVAGHALATKEMSNPMDMATMLTELSVLWGLRAPEPLSPFAVAIQETEIWQNRRKLIEEMERTMPDETWLSNTMTIVSSFLHKMFSRDDWHRQHFMFAIDGAGVVYTIECCEGGLGLRKALAAQALSAETIAEYEQRTKERGQ